MTALPLVLCAQLVTLAAAGAEPSRAAMEAASAAGPAAAADATRPALTAFPPSLEAAWKREVALLEGERAALLEERERLATAAQERLTGLRRDIGALEASLAAARAHNEGIQAELVRLERAGAVDEGLLRRAAAALRASLPMERGVGPGEDLEKLLDRALRDLESTARIERLDGGFFDSDGVWRDGRVVQVGALTAVAASLGEGPAGALVGRGPDGAGRLIRGAHGDVARRFVENGIGLAPLALGSVGAADPGTDEQNASWLARARAGGPFLWAVLFVGACTLAGSAWRIAWLWRAQHASRRAIEDIATLVESGEVAAAEALCRALPGPGASMWRTVVGAALRTSLEDMEERLEDALPDALARLERGQPLVVAGLALGLILGATAAAASHGSALTPLVVALWVTAPLTLTLAASSIMSRTLGVTLESGAFRLTDAARAARRTRP